MDDLRSFVEGVVGSGAFRVEEVLGDGYVRLNVSEAERRQAEQDVRWVEDIVVELLRNARDAHARHIYVATNREGNARHVVVLDDGDGIPSALQDRVFEARVTSKLDAFKHDDWGVHGRGMALFSIRHNAERASIVASGPGLGTSVAVDVDCSRLPERADQSSWPKLERGERGRTVIGAGPHNIQRTVLEFALAERGVEVYLGSPLEIAALLYRDDPHRLGLRDLLAVPQDDLPVCSRLRAAGDAPALRQACAGIGLDVSERSAYRIIAGSVEPARTVLASARVAHQAPRKDPDLHRDLRGVGFSKRDLEEIARRSREAAEPVAQRYFVSLGSPSATLRGDVLTVSFLVEHAD